MALIGEKWKECFCQMTEEEVFFLETDVVHLLVVGVMLFTFTQTIGQISNTFDFVNLQIVVQCRIGNSSSSFYWKVEGWPLYFFFGKAQVIL